MSITKRNPVHSILVYVCVFMWTVPLNTLLDLKVNIYKTGFTIKGKGWRRKKFYCIKLNK